MTDISATPSVCGYPAHSINFSVPSLRILLLPQRLAHLSLSALHDNSCTSHQVGLIAARRTGRLTGGKATAAIAEKAKEKK